MVKTLVLDVDFDEKSSILMDNPTIANPTNRQTEKKEVFNEGEVQKTRYSLRERKG